MRAGRSPVGQPSLAVCRALWRWSPRAFRQGCLDYREPSARPRVGSNHGSKIECREASAEGPWSTRSLLPLWYPDCHAAASARAARIRFSSASAKAHKQVPERKQASRTPGAFGQEGEMQARDCAKNLLYIFAIWISSRVSSLGFRAYPRPSWFLPVVDRTVIGTQHVFVDPVVIAERLLFWPHLIQSLTIVEDPALHDEDDVGGISNIL